MYEVCEVCQDRMEKIMKACTSSLVRVRQHKEWNVEWVMHGVVRQFGHLMRMGRMNL